MLVVLLNIVDSVHYNGVIMFRFCGRSTARRSFSRLEKSETDEKWPVLTSTALAHIDTLSELSVQLIGGYVDAV